MAEGNSKLKNGPLHGIRVLDLTRVLAGPWASQILADFGAEVIKVERPGSGDDTRSWGPPWLNDKEGHATSDSAYYLAANRNKRSITVDMSVPAGADIVRRLAASSDVVMENYKVGTLQRFGLDYPALKRLNPALVFCSITAYGQTGSRAEQPGYDAMMQASGGLMSITGAADEDGGSPQKVGVAIADIMAGMYAASAILAALIAVRESGAGQYIDVPLYDTQVAWLANQNMNYLVGGITPGRLGTAHPNLVPYQAFPTADGHLMLAVGNDRQFRACVECVGIPSLVDDERFADNASRVLHRDELVGLLSNGFSARNTEYWLDKLAQCGVPAGPINSIADVFSDRYASERQLERKVPHASAGDVPTVANPVRFSATPVTYRNAPPLLGEHTAEILSKELGLNDDEIEALADAGAI
jgi:crotonobetainyl-CoA:carnitine CoA-transferase CaiB-like acyl-CoA transferase